MCFSEPVSFAVGSVLIAGGVFAGWKAFNINKRYLPVSQMPTLAGLQQLMEGHVWMGMNNSDPSMVWWAAMGFIFFSWLIWPVWIPFSVYFLEPAASRRKLPLLGFALAGVAFGLILFVPHLFHPDWVRVRINHQSLSYWPDGYFVPAGQGVYCIGGAGPRGCGKGLEVCGAGGRYRRDECGRMVL